VARALLQEHVQNDPIDCVIGCGLKVAPKNQAQHEDVCTAKVVPCVAHEVGCQWRGYRGQSTTHVTTCPFHLLSAHLSELKQQITQAQQETQNELKQKLQKQDELKQKQNELLQVQNKLKHKTKAIEELQTTITQQQDQINTFRKGMTCKQIGGIYFCWGSCEIGNVYGAGPYQLCSHLCTAAKHAGVIPHSGGPFKVVEASASYSSIGITRNGITSQPYSGSSSSRCFTVTQP